jgi:cytochrome c553
MKNTLIALALLGLVSGTAWAGDAARGKEKAAVCAACHGADGNSPAPDFPRLAGQYEDYLYRALLDYKSGGRKNAIMQGQVGPLEKADMADLAAYFASQKGLENKR